MEVRRNIRINLIRITQTFEYGEGNKIIKLIDFITVAIWLLAASPAMAITVSGTISETSSLGGAGIDGVTVEVMVEGSSAGSTTTANGGAYGLTVPSATPFYLKMSKTGYNRTYGAEKTFSSNDTLNYVLTPEDLWSSLKVTSPFGIIRNKVNDQSGNPLSGAMVSAYSQIHQSSRYYKVCYQDGCPLGGPIATDTSGRYIVQSVEPGDTVTVNAQATGLLFHPRLFHIWGDSIHSEGLGAYATYSLTPPNGAFTVSLPARASFDFSTGAIDPMGFTGDFTYSGNDILGSFEVPLNVSRWEGNGLTSFQDWIANPNYLPPAGAWTSASGVSGSAGQWTRWIKTTEGRYAMIFPVSITPAQFDFYYVYPYGSYTWSSAPMPQTGQALCYDAVGTVITCAGTGQDGAIQAGVPWPNPRFTDKGDQTVLDNLTGLIWAKDGNLMKTRDSGFDIDYGAGDGKVTWQHALDYIKKLNQENYLGHNDWRLPNVSELESLGHAGQSNNAIWLNSQGYSNVQGGSYWSSTYYLSGASLSAWNVSMYGGDMYSSDAHADSKYADRYVWPVRSGQSGTVGSSIISLPSTGQPDCYDASGASIACAGTGQDGEMRAGVPWPVTRFSDNGDQTVLDKLTGLIWTQYANTPGPQTCGPHVPKTWQGSLDYVKCLNTNNYLGHNDWRLPNRKELRSLVSLSEPNTSYLPRQGFLNVPKTNYWSASTVAGNMLSAWYVYIYVGAVYYSSKSDHYYDVWPVRSGKFGSFASLVIAKSGSGSGNITSDPSGIICGAVCSADFNLNAPVTLTATPDKGFALDGWSGGGCSGTGTCMVTMNSAQSVTATFNQLAYTLSISKSGSGSGTVTSTSSGINCGSSCSSSYAPGTNVTLSANPSTDSIFAGWSGGGCSGTGQCTVAVDASKAVTATFSLNTYVITLPTITNGTISCNPITVDQGAGTSCILTPSIGYHFVALTDNEADVTSFVLGDTYTINNVLSNHTISATFAINTYTLAITKAGTGYGIVTSTPGGINCGNTCSASYDVGTETPVTLTASPTLGSTFTGWSSEGCTGLGSCSLIINNDLQITALFANPWGDVNNDGKIDLADAILSMQVLSNMDTAGKTITMAADTNNDSKIGIAEVIYVLQKLAGIR